MPIIRQYRNSDLDDVLSSWENTQTLAHPFLPDAFQKQEKKNIRELYLPNADTWVAELNSHVIGFIALIGTPFPARRFSKARKEEYTRALLTKC